MDILFQLSNAFVLPFWIAFIFFPRSKWTQTLLHHRLPTLALALIYSVLVIPSIPEILPYLIKPELSPIQTLLATPSGTTLIWIHVLAFDLLAATWILEEDTKAKRPALLTSVNLLLTLLFGPLGYALHLAKRRLIK